MLIFLNFLETFDDRLFFETDSIYNLRRRSGNELLDGPLDEKMNESIPENADRIIKFGNMPSYR